MGHPLVDAGCVGTMASARAFAGTPAKSRHVDEGLFDYRRGFEELQAHQK